MDTTNMTNGMTAPGTSAAVQTPTEPSAPTLADVIGVAAGEGQQATPNQDPQTQQQEPGWFQGRLAKERAKWEAERSADMAQMQEQLNALREYQVDAEADKLVADGKITDRDMAVEYVRSTKGIPAPQPKAAPTPARDAQGRFVATPEPEVPPEIQQRANELFAQAKTIKSMTGVDVLAVYRSNAEYAEKINSGEWDMVDVMRAYGGSGAQASPAPAVPSVIRTPNSGAVGAVDIRSMSDEQFRKLNEYLDHGGKIDMRR